MASLAYAVAEARRPLTPRQALKVHVLWSASVYRDAGRLDAWEQAYANAARDTEPSPVDELLDAIFELGTYNMYRAFDAPGTLREYQHLQKKFAAEDVFAPATPHLSDW
jgi:hypothetical protein